MARILREAKNPTTSSIGEKRADCSLGTCGRRKIFAHRPNNDENEKPAERRAFVKLPILETFRKLLIPETWSGRRDSNPRPRPWQGRALPLSYTRILRERRRTVTGDRRPMPNADCECNSAHAA